MEAFFDDAPSDGHSCASVVDLQQHLQHLLQSKVTPTKAEHISVTFELRSNVVFSIPVTEQENASLEAGAGIDPRLAGARASVPANDEQTVRHFNAIDTVLNQSQDHNLVQRIVSKHIMSIIGEADQSQWMLRSMARGTQGWTFTYSCKDSWQMWEKEKAKNPPKTVVGEWSNKDGQDPTNLSRPAFDCRGSLTIAFSKSEKAISVKYEHTAMHQTVEQLMNLLAPPPPPQPTRAELRQTAPKKTPRSKRPSQAVDLTGEGGENGGETGAEGATPRPKKRKKAAAQDGEGSAPKKRTKKRKTDDVNIDPSLGMPPPEMPGALPVGDSSQRPLYNSQPQDGAGPNSAYPEPLVGANGPQDAASAMVSSSVHQHSILNLPPGEAERRREVAIRLLADKGIDPATLSAEQFSILANQSPQLQQESLAMLQKYGAERLKIILPDKDANAQPAPAQNDQHAGPVQQSSNAAETPTRKGGRTKKPTLKAQNADTSMTDDGTPAKATARQKKPKLTRGACAPCRDAKLKCNKNKPTCDKCVEFGTECSYPLQVPKKSKALGDEPEDAAEPELPRGSGGAEKAPDAQNADADVDEDPDDLPSPGFTAYYPDLQGNQNGDHSGTQHPYQDADESQYQDTEAPEPEHEAQQEQEQEQESVTTQDNHQSTYSDSHHSGVYRHSSGLTFPQSITPDVTQQVWTSTSAADYNPAPAHSSSNVGLTLGQHSEEPTPTSVSFPDHTSPTITRASTNRTHVPEKSWGSYTSSQREAPVTTSTASDNLANILGDNSWPEYSAAEARQSSNLRTSPRQSRRAAKAVDVAAYHDGMRSVSALAQAAINNVSKSASPVPQNPQHEPATATSRAKSRQGHRALAQAQTRTPVPSHAGPARQQQRSAPSITPAPAASYSTATDKNTASYKTTSYYSNNTDQSSNGVAYQPNYHQNTSSTTSSNFPGYDSYNTRTNHSSGNTMPLSNATPQVATSYTSSTPSTTNQWTDTSSSSQTRNPLPYSAASSTPASSSLNLRPSANQAVQRSHGMQSFNVRPQPPAHTQPRSSTTTSYGQQPQPAYNSYSSQPQQQQQTSSNPNHQGWYVGNTSSSTAAYGTSGGRGSGAAAASGSYSGGGTGSHSGQHYAQQQQQHGAQPQHAHHAMNLSGHTYSSMDQFNILPGGSGH